MATNFGHIELITQNLDKAKDFYQKLFGWKVRDLPDMPYSLFNEQLSPTGGMMKSPKAGSESFWIPYIVTDDITGVTESPESGSDDPSRGDGGWQYGWLSIINDPTGAVRSVASENGPEAAKKKADCQTRQSRLKRRRR
jgi:predicted enzyme related to lactoylglutathione lyase